MHEIFRRQLHTEAYEKSELVTGSGSTNAWPAAWIGDEYQKRWNNREKEMGLFIIDGY